MPDKAVTFLRLLGDLEELENFIDEVANHSKLSILKRRLQVLEELKVKCKDFVDGFDSESIGLASDDVSEESQYRFRDIQVQIVETLAKYDMQ